MVTIANSEDEFYDLAALHIVAQIKEKPTSVIALSTGRTTCGIHHRFVEWCMSHTVDLSRTTFIGVDEVTGVDRTYSGACYTMLKTQIADPLGLADSQLLMLPTHSEDFNTDIEIFRHKIYRLGGIDLLLLGIGENGHLGFNQPGTPFSSTIHLSHMDNQLESRIRRETATPSDIPLGGITLGLNDMMHARRILLLANGSNKAAIIQKAIHGPVTEDVPSSILQLHPHCEYLLDQKAAAELSQPISS